jgi:hypothetical protein
LASVDTNDTVCRYTAQGWVPADLTARALAPRLAGDHAPEAVAVQRAIT